MKKKMTEPEKSWFIKVPARLTDIIQESGSELTPQTAQNELPTGVPTGEPTGSTPIISARVGDIESKRVGDKENKRFNPRYLDNSGPLVGDAEPSHLSILDKKTDKAEECFLTAESTWDEYLGKLTLNSHCRGDVLFRTAKIHASNLLKPCIE